MCAARFFPSFFVFIIMFLSQACQRPSPEYPRSKTVDHSDQYGSISVADPYRWLETMDSEETGDWIRTQNEVTQNVLSGIGFRDKVEEQLRSFWDYEKFSTPRIEGDFEFFTYNSGLQNVAPLFRAPLGQAKQRQLVLDPNTFSDDGTVSLAGYTVSPDGTHLAYLTSTSGSDWREIHVKNLQTGENLSDHIRWVKFSGITFSPSGRGFYYSRFPEPSGDKLSSVVENQAIYYHRIGSDQSEDERIFAVPKQARWNFNARVTPDGKFMIITISEGTDEENRVYYRDLRKSSTPIIRLLDNKDASYQFVGNDGGTFYFLTSRDAPKGKLIAIDITDPRPSRWKTLIPESEDVLQSVNLTTDRFVAEYLHNASSKLLLFDRQGEPTRELELPEIGSVGAIQTDIAHDTWYFSFQSFTRPSGIFRVNGSESPQPYLTPELNFNPDDFQTRQEWFSSKDGTRIPMFIVQHKRQPKLLKPIDRILLRNKGGFPTLMYGYGGFNISLTPSFSVPNLAWIASGGTYVLVTLRGGGEFGQAWHEAGMLANKQNVFDDFIGAAEHLIEHENTSPQRLGIRGGSNGGLLVGAALTQRPDLFGVAIPAVGVLDMLRYQYFSIGWAWAGEYGRSDNPEHFDFLRAYSPLHNIKDGIRYPATLIMTSDHDDRVVPAHSYKFAATLQKAQRGRAPILLRVETKAGHGAGKPISKQIEEAADWISFSFANMNFRPR